MNMSPRKMLLPGLLFSMLCCVAACTPMMDQIKSDVSIYRADTLYEESNYAGAVEQYRIAAESGSPRAQYVLVRMYAQGKGTARNQSEAVRWIQQAAFNGYNAASFDMGLRYLTADGVPGSLDQSLMHFRRAAENEHSLSMYALGTAYAFGWGVQPDAGEALRWFRMAHAYGYPLHSSLLSESGVIAFMQKPATLPGVQANRLLNPSKVQDASLIQKKLAQLGYYTMKIDGLWGQGSQKALQHFQRANGLRADGKWNRETQKKLLTLAGH